MLMLLLPKSGKSKRRKVKGKVNISGDYMSNTEDLVSRHIKGIAPYEPIVPPEELARRFGIPSEKIIKLNGNENLYGCSPRAKKALADYSQYHIYPDPEQRKLREALSKYIDIDMENIMVGSGSDDYIDLVLRLFVEVDDEVISCPPTFGMYPFSTAVCGGRLVEINRHEDFTLDIAAIKQAINKRTKVIFLASPNNPSGNTAPREEILELLKEGKILVVDEAYQEFSSGASAIDLILRYDNLIVLRTFSKWAGLAGLRVGYALCPVRIAQYFMRIKQPYNVNVAAEVAALASLADLTYLKSTIAAIIQERGRLSDKLKKNSFLKVYPSEANFILCAVLNGKAKDIYQNLQRKGIFIRYYNNPLLKDYIRISIGKPEHTDVIITALEEMANAGGW